MANLRGITSKQAFNILDSGIRNNEVLKGPPPSFVILDDGGHVINWHILKIVAQLPAGK